MITAEQFEAATGRAPEQDDLHRVNCPDAGKLGHLSCGWDHEHNRPIFEMAPRVLTMLRDTASSDPKPDDWREPRADDELGQIVTQEGGV